MNDHLDQRQIRVTKLETLRGKGINPYPYSFQNSHTLPDLLEIGKILVESEEEASQQTSDEEEPQDEASEDSDSSELRQDDSFESRLNRLMGER